MYSSIILFISTLHTKMQSTTELDVNQLIQLIDSTLSGNNQLIQQATKILKAYTKHHHAIKNLTYILANASNLSHRQMASVLLKRNLPQLYEGLPPQEKSQFRNVLLQQYANESSSLIQKGISTLIGILLPIVELKNWVQLQGLLDLAMKSAPESVATFLLLNNILYNFKASPQIYQYLLNALSNPRLAEEAMRCVVAVAESQDIDPAFATSFVKIWENSNWPEDISLIAVEVMTVLVERKIRLEDEVMIWICQRIVGNNKISNRLRTAGCDCLFSLAELSPKLLGSRDRLLKKMVEIVCLTCSEPYKHREEDEQTGEFVQQIALWLIQTLAITIKPKKIYPILFDLAVKFIHSNEPNQMNTGFLILGAISEGCADKLKKNLQNPVMNQLIPLGLNNMAAEVRGAAINAICYFSEHLVPDIFDYHGVIIPALVKQARDVSHKVGGKALVAIDVFFDGMEKEDIVNYLQLTIPMLMGVLGDSSTTVLMKTASISAIGSAVYVSQFCIQPFLPQIIQVCLSLLTIPSHPQTNSLRAENINVFGKLANVFCKAQYQHHLLFYQTYIMSVMEQIYGFLVNEQDPQIREACFAFFYLIANAIGNRFEVVFDKLIPIILTACEPKQLLRKPNQQISLDSDSQDDDGAHVVAHKGTEQDEKAAAIHALGQMAKSCPIKFQPYFQKAYEILEEYYQHFYENIRVQVCHCYTNLTIGLVKSRYGGMVPIHKKGLPCYERFEAALQEHFKIKIIPKLIMLMTEDDDNKVRGAAIESINDLLKQLGAAFVDSSLEPLKEAIMKLLQSQIEEEEEQQEIDEEQTEVNTFEALCDLIPTLAESLLGGFQPILHQLHPYLMKYLEEREDINDNIQMTGCLAQCFKWSPGYAPNHSQEIFNYFSHLFTLAETDLNRNIAYGFAELFEKSAPFFINYLPDGLLILKRMFQDQKSSQACKDNAIAAICRIIYTINPAIPHEIFVKNLMGVLPFKGDQEEQGSALKAILFLININSSLFIIHKNKLIDILQNDLRSPQKYHLEQPIVNQLQVLLANLK